MHYTHRFSVRAPLSAVAGFHRDTRALPRLTPPPVFVRIHRLEPLGEGSCADMTMWMGPIPIHWLARHSQVDPLHGFTDEQVRGPFTRWVHRHAFTRLDEHSSEISDSIEAEFGHGLFNGLVSRLMWYSLPLLFAYRAWATRRALAQAAA